MFIIGCNACHFRFIITEHLLTVVFLRFFLSCCIYIYACFVAHFSVYHKLVNKDLYISYVALVLHFLLNRLLAIVGLHFLLQSFHGTLSSNLYPTFISRPVVGDSVGILL